ncbi:MFS transporter [Maribacter hydrothermalis]|uniref:MFS transporter permease n=1 Tax=Maribacter hydrothermalis TaxID=1836467 RepID=A0A1B7Z1T3_9FLAO|nr:MFS transporter [Maribacter hydrothermalis]APQ18329.1 MFS transporter [Maribacter hydrothermalis]OBR36675.1 MFS transporter permease [Maribacter hydrothermalis]
MKQPDKAPWYYLLLLILAGESVFILPFVLQRVFRPTVLKVFELDNVSLGLCFSVYGFVALVSYLLGGPLADKYQPRKLIAIALWMTALGGLVFATFPDYFTLQVLYGFWGFTTIFLFWSPMIKATRVWGGQSSQGKAFGLLDGGRGLVGALFGTLGVLVFSYFMSADIAVATLEESRFAFRYVILISAGIVALVGFLVWVFMKLPKGLEKEIVVDRITTSQIKEVLRLPSVLLLMIIILCAYVGYKITDVFSLYAQDVMSYNEVESAEVGTFLLFARPIVGVFIGISADRSRPSLFLLIGFIIALIGSLIFASGIISEVSYFMFLFSIMIVALGVYAIRSLYFAVMQSGKIPLILTGTAVGLISLIGYTPDIFAGPAMGYLLDASPGLKGHQHVFYMLAVFSFIGGIAAFRYFQLYGKPFNDHTKKP